MSTTLRWLRRAGIVGVTLAFGAILAYGLDLVLDLFRYNTQVIIGMVLSLLTVSLVIWWMVDALSEALEDIREARDEIDNARAESAELLSYVRELMVITRGEVEALAERASAEGSAGVHSMEGAPTQVMQAVRADTEVAPEEMEAMRTDTTEAPAMNIAGGARLPVSDKPEETEPVENVEAWARAEVARMWGDKPASASTQDSVPTFIEPTPVKPAPTKQTGSMSASKKAAS